MSSSSTNTAAPVTWIVTGTGGHLGSHVVREVRKICEKLLSAVQSLERKTRLNPDAERWKYVSIVPSRVIAVYHQNSKMLPSLNKGNIEDEEEDIEKEEGSASSIEIVQKSVNLTDLTQLSQLISSEQPAVFIHCAAISNVTYAFQHQVETQAMNVDVPRNIAKLLREQYEKQNKNKMGETTKTKTTEENKSFSSPCIFLYTSTDMVFNGKLQIPSTTANLKTAVTSKSEPPPPSESILRAKERDLYYKETDVTTPLSVYGRSKADSERAIFEEGWWPYSYVIRCPLMFGVAHSTKMSQGTFYSQLQAVLSGQSHLLKGFCDEFRTPASFQYVSRVLIFLGLVFRLQLLEHQTDRRNGGRALVTSATAPPSSWSSSMKKETSVAAEEIEREEEEHLPGKGEGGKEKKGSHTTSADEMSKSSHVFHAGGPRRLSRLELLQLLHQVVKSAQKKPTEEQITIYDKNKKTNVKKPQDGSGGETEATTNPEEKSSPSETAETKKEGGKKEGEDDSRIQSISQKSIPSSEPRPEDLSLKSDKLEKALLLLQLPSLLLAEEEQEKVKQEEKQEVPQNSESIASSAKIAEDVDVEEAEDQKKNCAQKAAQQSALEKRIGPNIFEATTACGNVVSPVFRLVGDSIRLLAQEFVFSQSVKDMLRECVQHYQLLEKGWRGN